MDKNKIILSAIMATLIALYKYQPSQLEAMMGDKFESFDKHFNDFEDKDYEKELIKLFNEYLNIV